MADQQTYRHASGLFSLELPRGWHVEDSSTQRELNVRFTDPNQNGVVQTNLLTMTQPLDQANLPDMLRTYLRDGYASQPGFSQQQAAKQQGFWSIAWGYDTTLPSGHSARMQGYSGILQRGHVIGLISVVVPAEQWPQLKPDVEHVLASYTILPTQANAGEGTSPLVSVQLAPTEMYTHTNELFSLEVPSHWSKHDSSAEEKAFVTWTDPTNNGWMLVNVVTEDSQRTPEELATLLSETVREAFGSQAEFTLSEITPQGDDRFKATWSYVAAADTGMKARLRGTGVIEKRREKTAIVALALPEDQFENQSAAITSLLDSFHLNQKAPAP